MTPIPDSEVPVLLDELAARIRNSSHFRFAWQWFSLESAVRFSSAGARQVVSELVDSPACHSFLRGSFVPEYDPTFTIQSVHEHCKFKKVTHSFERILARAFADRLGAFSRNLIEAESSDIDMVRQVFGAVSPYTVFQLEPGRKKQCPVCVAHGGYLFTNWFYGVAWDWCFCLLPLRRRIAWVGFLTDTD